MPFIIFPALLFTFLSLPILILVLCISIPVAYCIDSSNVTQLSKKSIKIFIVSVVTLVMIIPVTFIILLHIIFTQLITLTITLILFPLLLPTYLIKGDRLFVSVKTKLDFSMPCYWTFKGTVVFCYWLFCPFWLLLETIYDSWKDKSNIVETTINSVETIRSSVETVTRIYECAICYNEMNKDGRHKQGREFCDF